MDDLAGILAELEPDLGPLTAASEDIGRQICARAVALMGPHRPVSYGKAGLVGVNGEQEHAVAMLTTVFGNVMRDAAGGGTFKGVGPLANGQSAGIYPVNSPCFSFPNSLAKLRTSYGFGLRWFSPLGPLRFEWGFPIAPLPYEESSVFEFTIGNFF